LHGAEEVRVNDPQPPPPPAGWYPDKSGVLNWWDGSKWTDHKHLPTETEPAAPLSEPADSTPDPDVVDGENYRRIPINERPVTRENWWYHGLPYKTFKLAGKMLLYVLGMATAYAVFQQTWIVVVLMLSMVPAAIWLFISALREL
jgi:hypothetical protein